MTEPRRVSPEHAHQAVAAGDALLVCGYDDEEKCRSMRLEGSMNLRDLQEMLPKVPKDREIIFYCA